MDKNSQDKLIGIIPAAGKGRRLFPLPGSKELFPIGFNRTQKGTNEQWHPKVISQYLVDNMIEAGVMKIIFIINREKCDIIKYYGSGDHFGVHFTYMVADHSLGMPYSINQAYPWIRDATIVFGMPDTIFTPTNSLGLLLEQHKKSKADVTLGIYPTDQPWRFGMVRIDENHRLIHCVDKPYMTDLKYMWGNACWEQSFTDLVNDRLKSLTMDKDEEIVLSSFFQMAVDEGLDVSVFKFDQGEYIDIGFPNDLVQAIEKYSQRK